MLRLRSEQKAELGRRSQRKFELRMADYLATEWARRVGDWSRAELERWTNAAIAKSLRYRVDTEPEVAQLMLLLLALGIDADEQNEWIGEILTSRTLHGKGKVRALVEGCETRGLTDVAEYVVFDRFRVTPKPGEEDLTPGLGDD